MLYFIPGISFFPLDIIFLLDFYIILEEYVLSVSKFIGIKLFWGEGGLLFIYDNYPTAVILSSQKFFETIPPALASRRMDGVVWFTHPANGPADSLGLNWLLNLSPCQPLHLHLNGSVVPDANVAVAGRAFLLHIQVHKLNSVLLHMEDTLAATANSHF